MDIRELNEILIKSMENACDDTFQFALDDGENFTNEYDIIEYVTDFGGTAFIVECMINDWERYNGCEINRDVVEIVFQQNDTTINNFYSILANYCEDLIDHYIDDWADKTYKAISGEV